MGRKYLWQTLKFLGTALGAKCISDFEPQSVTVTIVVGFTNRWQIPAHTRVCI